jgi:hypothetical protein
LAAAKELAKDIPKTARTIEVKVNVLPVEVESFERIAARTATGATAHTRVTKLIIALTFLLIFQDFIGFINFLKLGLITTLFVGVMFDSSYMIR